MKYHVLRELNVIVNHKKMYRLYKELKLFVKKIKITRTKKNIAKNRTIKRSNRLWELDIKYGYIAGERKNFYICEVIDVFDRNIISYYMGYHCKAPDVALLLKAAYNKRNIDENDKLIVRTDNGTQFTSKIFEKKCKDLNIYHERIPNATPNKNAHIESFHSILEREFLSDACFRKISDAHRRMDNFINLYNNKRIHGSIGNMPPSEFYEKHRANDNTLEKIVVNL